MNSIELMQNGISEYFTYEKIESAFFIAAGLCAILVSALIILKFVSYRGMIILLVAIGLIQLVVGSAVFFRTGAQIEPLRGELAIDAREF